METSDRPLQIFVHALDDSGAIVAQWDGLHLDPASLRVGDRFAQLHTLALPESDQVAAFALGVYDAETGVRSGSPLPLIIRE